LGFWSREIRGAEPLTLPYTVGEWRPGARLGIFPAVVFTVAGCSANTVAQAGRVSGGTSASAVILAAFVAALAQITGQRDLLLNTALTDRGSPRKRELVGTLANLCVLRLRLPDDLRPDAVIRVAKNALARALRYQIGPFHREGRYTEAGRVLTLSPKVTVSLNQDVGARIDSRVVSRGDTAGARLSGPCLIQETVGNGTSDLHVEVLSSRRDGPLRFKITYRPDLWEPAGIETLGTAMADRLLRLTSMCRAGRGA
jgi:non-ribosomal peptide synthetase component F